MLLYSFVFTSFFLEYALAVKIRLKRTGMPKQASYRIVVCESTNQRDGAVITNIGYYSPYKPGQPLHLEMELYNSWLAKGAKPSATVKKLARLFEKKPGETGSVAPRAAEVPTGGEPAG